MKFDYAGLKIQMIVLAEQNQQIFKGVINLAKERYIESIDDSSMPKLDM